MYIAEIAPAAWRGRLVGAFQINIIGGILLAYLSNYVIGMFAFGDLRVALAAGDRSRAGGIVSIDADRYSAEPAMADCDRVARRRQSQVLGKARLAAAAG